MVVTTKPLPPPGEHVAEKPTYYEGEPRHVLTGTLTMIDGKVYDIKPFLDRHPGGNDLLRLAAGRDATVMFHSYHRYVAKRVRRGRAGARGRSQRTSRGTH